DLADPARGQLEGPRVDTDDVVHRVMMVERYRGGRIDGELVTPPDRPARDHAPHARRFRPLPVAAPDPDRIVEQRGDQALAVRIPASDQADRSGVLLLLLPAQTDRVMKIGHAIVREIVEVAQAKRLEGAKRIAILGEERI